MSAQGEWPADLADQNLFSVDSVPTPTPQRVLTTARPHAIDSISLMLVPAETGSGIADHVAFTIGRAHILHKTFKRDARVFGEQRQFTRKARRALVIGPGNHVEAATGQFAPYDRHDGLAKCLERQQIRDDGTNRRTAPKGRHSGAVQA